MLDIVVVRREPDRVRRSALHRGLDPSFVDDILRYDAEYRCALAAAQRTQAEKNALTTEIAGASDRSRAAAALRPQIEALSATIARDQERARALSPDDDQSPLRALLCGTPNLLADSVPEGDSEDANVVVRTWGEPRRFDFEPKPHWEIGETLGILDFERASKLSGSRFAVLKDKGARLSRSLAQFFLDRACDRGYIEIVPPLLVNRTTMWSTGQLSKFADAMFYDSDAELFMIPTAEVPLTALRGGEILSGAELPLQYSAYTPCFRKEAGAAGKDTRGLVRQHQFEKVELVWVTAPESSFASLETLVQDAEALLQALELPYRVVSLCGGDTGFNAAKTYDLEVWFPSAGRYREISSCSNCTDFQARRASLRFRRDAKARPEFAHTLNGSGLAIGRSFAALLENHQQANGSVGIPPELRPYAGFSTIQLR